MEQGGFSRQLWLVRQHTVGLTLSVSQSCVQQVEHTQLRTILASVWQWDKIWLWFPSYTCSRYSAHVQLLYDSDAELVNYKHGRDARRRQALTSTTRARLSSKCPWLTARRTLCTLASCDVKLLSLSVLTCSNSHVHWDVDALNWRLKVWKDDIILVFMFYLGTCRLLWVGSGRFLRGSCRVIEMTRVQHCVSYVFRRC